MNKKQVERIAGISMLIGVLIMLGTIYAINVYAGLFATAVLFVLFGKVASDAAKETKP